MLKSAESKSVVRRVIAGWSAAAVVAGVSAGAGAQPITVSPFEQNVQGGVMRGFTAVIDLSDPTVEIVVTGPTPTGTPEAVKKRTDQWFTETGVDLAINANYFGSINATDADIVGLAISDSVVVSPVRTFGGRADPAIAFTADSAFAGYLEAGTLVGVLDAVAGVGGSTTDAVPGTMLVLDGQNLGSTARVQPSTRNPRTAAGVSADGSTLYIAVIDGRQPGYSVGATLPEMADIMIDLGADDAVNLDGGGSSSFIASVDGTAYENQPSDGQHRPTANHLGVRITTGGGGPAPGAPVQDERPIRGAWLRPTGNAFATGVLLDELADAGVTDLYLESFYHGLATHESAFLNERFSRDVLLETMGLAAQRGIRTHAWLEAAYWSFGGAGTYLYQNNPEWKVVDWQQRTDIGDINTSDPTGQVFVNLGNPGVQAVLADVCTEIAENYPGLWGLQTDYHRFPLDNNTSDGVAAPYSFDSWSRAEFQGIFGVDPLADALVPSDPFYDEFVSFRRNGIAFASKVMNDAIVAADPGKQFSGAVFATAIADRFCNPNQSQLVKMQDWPTMAAQGWLPIVVPMVYGSTTTAIRNDVRAVNNQVVNPCGTSGNTEPNARVVAGLAIINPNSRPGVTSQLATIYNEGVDSFIWFEANALTVTQANIDDHRNYILTNGPFQNADFDQDTLIDAADWDAFYAYYTGAPVSGASVYDLTGDGVVDADDEAVFLQAFRAFRFGEDGVLGEEEYIVLLDNFTQPGANFPRHLYDLTGDGEVDCSDVRRMRTILSEDVGLLVNPDVDADADVDQADYNGYLSLLGSSAEKADVAPVGAPDGVFDYFDAAAYIEAAARSCP